MVWDTLHGRCIFEGRDIMVGFKCIKWVNVPGRYRCI